VLCFAIVFLFIASPFVFGDTTVEPHLSIVPGPGLLLNFTLSNPSEKYVAVVAWGTPMEGVMGKIFEITDEDGNQVPYIGKLVRRAWPPAATSFIHLEPNGSISAVVDLTEDFAFPHAGYYTISYRVPEFNSGVTFSQGNRIIGHAEAVVDRKASAAWANTNCNANQNSQISAAVSGAILDAKASWNCMEKRTCDTIVTRWFGAFEQTRYSYDKSVFEKIHTRLNSHPFVAYCNPPGCPSDVYAYVYPSDRTYTVYLCGVFWSVPNERVNTIVHEMSHFDTLGGTDDYAYGKSACLNLAKTSPTKASHNADNVCYFADEAVLL